MSINCLGIVGENRQVIVPVRVAPYLWWKNMNMRRLGVLPVPINALVDTGANISCIPPSLAKKLDLPLMDKKPAMTASGISESKVYRVDIRIIDPHHKKSMGGINYAEFGNVKVMENFGNYMLLGMDIIMQGELRIKGNNFILRL